MTDREYVESKWERAEPCPRESKVGDGEEWALSLGGFYYTRYATDWCDSEPSAWSAAAEFTRAREEEIRQLATEVERAREEHDYYCLKVQQVMLGERDVPRYSPLMRPILLAWVADSCACGRILVRLESIRAELQRGMLAEPRKHEGEVKP